MGCPCCADRVCAGEFNEYNTQWRYQTYKAQRRGGYVRDHFFGHVTHRRLVEDMSDQDTGEPQGRPRLPQGLRRLPRRRRPRDSRR